MTYRSSSAQILDGPHQGRVINNIGPAPPTLVLMDANWCYHEYTRIEPLQALHRYVYLQRLGRPHWASFL